MLRLLSLVKGHPHRGPSGPPWSCRPESLVSRSRDRRSCWNEGLRKSAKRQKKPGPRRTDRDMKGGPEGRGGPRDKGTEDRRLLMDQTPPHHGLYNLFRLGGVEIESKVYSIGVGHQARGQGHGWEWYDLVGQEEMYTFCFSLQKTRTRPIMVRRGRHGSFAKNGVCNAFALIGRTIHITLTKD